MTCRHVASVRNWEGGSIPRGPIFKRLAEALLVKPEALRDDDADAATDLTVADIFDEAKETLARVMGIGVERISLNATIA